MRIIATAGHVDHGKSTLVRALTGMEPDRWAEERRRGMTIDLGYAWTSLPSGVELAFVDVPGHQRFIGNMLAGLGPAPAVLFVVAADEGWSRQSEEHLAAADALGIAHGVLAVTRCDLADPAAAMEQGRAKLAGSSLGDVEAVAVSGVTGAGMDGLRAALQRLVDRLPPPDVDAPTRLWVDRVFTVRGAGTVVTGTLGTGAISLGDRFQLREHQVTVRGMQCLGREREHVEAPARVALNLRGVGAGDVERGDALVDAAAWYSADQLDVRLRCRTKPAGQLLLHLGSATLPVRVRPLGEDGAELLARLSLPRPIPVRAGDRGVLRDPGRQTVAAGVLLLDVDPPELSRRGAAAARAAELSAATGVVDPRRELARRGAMRRTHLEALGGRAAAGIREHDGWLLDDGAWQRWTQQTPTAVQGWAQHNPLDPAMPVRALRRALGLPTDEVAAAVADAAGLRVSEGRVAPPAAPESLGPAEGALRRLEARFQDDPFAAPSANELRDLGLGRRELAAAERHGRLIRITDDVVLPPAAPGEALRRLAGLPQPFTASDARAALATSRRVAIPLLELLDSRGDTVRIDPVHRRVRADTQATG